MIRLIDLLNNLVKIEKFFINIGQIFKGKMAPKNEDKHLFGFSEILRTKYLVVWKNPSWNLLYSKI